MRTNYKRIKRVLESTGAEVEQSRANGLVAVYDLGLESEQRVRVVLVDGRDYSNEVGCHMTRISQDDFDSCLTDTVETALKDMYPTIWIHQQSKPSEETRQRLLKSIDGWVKGFEKHVPSAHSLNKIETDLNTILQSMNQEQAQAILMLIVASSVKASDESRAWWSEKYHSLRAEKKNEGIGA